MLVRRESLAATKLTLFRDEQPLYPASGFIHRFGQDVMLVTNWHVLSGTNPLTREVKGLPNRVEFCYTVGDRETGTVEIKGACINLVVDDQAVWWQHPGFLDLDGKMQIVDVAVIRLNDKIANFQTVKDLVVAYDSQVIIQIDENKVPRYTDGYARVASEIFILGFPKGLEAQGTFPIWKRASIASEPLFGILNNAPAMFVDTSTREGMSGAPALYFGADIISSDGRLVDGPPSSKPWLLGVYAGRDGVTKDENETVLGRVWHSRLINEIVFKKLPGLT